MEALARRSTAPFQNHLCTAHRLNPRQSHWELHLERFNFTLSYKSGARNIKPDTLSCQFSPNEGDFGEETILPSACVVGVTRWEEEDQIWQAEQDYRVPKNCPTDRLSLSLPSPLFFNGGTLLRSHAIQVFIALWNYSNSTLDFVTGLPPSEENTTILTIVDRFFKMVHYIPLPKLPLALKTASLLVQHVFRLHGIPQDIVSDQGPSSSCRYGGVSARRWERLQAFSGYHPQSNAQSVPSLTPQGVQPNPSPLS